MIIVSNLKSGNWRHFMPVEYQLAENPSEMSAEERARKDSGIGRAFENIARSLADK